MNLTHAFVSAPKYLPWILGCIAGLILLIAIVALITKLLNWRWLMKRKLVRLELTPPASVGRTPEATQKLFAVIHGFRNIRPMREKLLHRQTTIAFEIDSTHEGGVRYVTQIDKRLAASLHQAVNSYLPEVKVAIISNIEVIEPHARVVTFKQTGHYAFPLAALDFMDQHDLAAYLTGAMTKLNTGEHMCFQLIATPIKSREASILAHKILGNEDLLTQLSGRRLPFLTPLMGLINSGLFSVTDAVGEVYHGSTKSSFQASQRSAQQKLQVARRERPARTLSAFELELMESIHMKVSQPLFKVSVRVAITADSQQEVKSRLGAIKSALESYAVPSYQSLQARMSLPLVTRFRGYAFTHRLPNIFTRDTVLSASEIANIYHFPLSKGSKTDNLVTSLSRTLPAPISLKQDRPLGLIIGQNEHHGTSTPIGLTEQERERHIYIIGGTGNGKTTMLQYAIVQDMQCGKGLTVIDPHGDMAEAMLRHVPKDRIHDVVYFNPDDLSYPIGLNLLELTEGLTGDELLREKDLVTESVISVFRKIFSDEDTGGHRIEYVLRNTIQTALTIPDATLFTVFDLLNDPKYRKGVIKTLESKDLRNFWKNELGKAGDMQKVKMAAGITSKIGRFLFSASAKRILEQPKSTINFDDIINSGKILICNFSKGLIGEDTSELFGITVLAKLQLTSLRRARLAQQERRAFYLYVDEFQNFATPSFVQMLSESRKYKLYMTMAEQSTSQQKDQQMVNIILANVGTVITFRTGNPMDERLLLPLFNPYIREGEISNLSSFNFYAKLSAVKSQEPLSGQTLLLEGTGSSDVAALAIRQSRDTFAKRPSAEVREIAVSTPVANPETNATMPRKPKGNKMLDMA
jgi:hypothetical protein